jgi:hypothetical protein
MGSNLMQTTQVLKEIASRLGNRYGVVLLPTSIHVGIVMTANTDG